VPDLRHPSLVSGPAEDPARAPEQDASTDESYPRNAEPNAELQRLIHHDLPCAFHPLRVFSAVVTMDVVQSLFPHDTGRNMCM
jgi:hypothetical protein